MMKQIKTNTRGFTLIELLVVIAIIGILASVVLASLNSARDKGTNAAYKSTLNNMRAQAELFYDTNGTTNGYTGLCTSADNDNPTLVTTLDDAIATAITGAGAGADCDSSSSAYAFQATLLTTPVTYYCVDSTGRSITGTTAKAAAATVCP